MRCLFRDLGERSLLEREARKLNKLISLSQLAGGVAHDFNNLLTAVITNLAIADEEARSGEDVTESISQAVQAAMRARSLTRQLLTFTKGDAPVKKTASIEEILKSAARFVLRGSRCAAEFDIQDGLWSADIDADQIYQVIENLVINATQAMPNGGTIRVGAANIPRRDTSPAGVVDLPSGNYVGISIADSGTGIQREQIEKIFDPYFTTKKDGNGLGLAVVKSLIDRHAGHINVGSIEGNGTTFTVYLPATGKPSTIPRSVRKAPIHGSGKVLVMDDDPLVRYSFERLLTRLGYETHITDEGSKTIVAYRAALHSERPFDAVIMDLTVAGGMGGVETIEKLLELDPEIKAIVCSGYSQGKVINNYERYGFKGVIVKPFEMTEIAELLHKVICTRKRGLAADENGISNHMGAVSAKQYSLP